MFMKLIYLYSQLGKVFTGPQCNEKVGNGSNDVSCFISKYASM